jgi:hypothetical protein
MYNPHYQTRPLCKSAKRFAECQISGTRQSRSLLRAALGKEKHSATVALPSARQAHIQTNLKDKDKKKE